MPSVASLRVVIIEDHALLRELLAAFVRSLAGHEVVAECATLADGLRVCRELHPDLVLMEWTLPDGTGEQLLKPLVTELSATRWLVLCARQNGQIVQSALAHGAHGFLMKQSNVAALREAIERLGQGGTYYCPLSSNVLLEVLRTRVRPNGDGLTERELEVLRHFTAGSNPRSIAAQLKISTKTVQNQLSAVRQKLGIQETAGLVRYAIRIGLDDDGTLHVPEGAGSVPPPVFTPAPNGAGLNISPEAAPRSCPPESGASSPRPRRRNSPRD